MRIAIIGATGMLGRAVTRELICAGNTVQLIARDAAQTKQLFPNASVVPGNMNDKSSLVAALQGIGIVYLNLSVKQTERETDFHTEEQGLINLIEAARLTGVHRVAYLSSLVMRYQGMNGFTWWVFRVKQHAVRLIKESGIPYSIFYPSNFMDSLNGTQRMGWYILLVGRSSVRPFYIAAADYGKQVARALSQAAGENQEYIIKGPEALSQHEAAHRFAAAYKAEPLSVVTAPPFLMKLGGHFSAQADYGWHITHALNHYPERFEADRTWAELGKPATTLEAFAKG
ncbi:SDR family oxidoreductase [Spirosoma utsteinense]|uniref:NAD(P)-binding domain-containing protein n=1 Tax=Spirosoma utsteinense TaxID=2585773 RepID=A0ABR6W1G7_9BACT|nr:NAD(P)H-binding protein [Spirosoma utsteinense]MBC3784696.1 putative protein YbjT (DUF2867 family) [Spirosoma utsteinense]MBC3789550.1 putative protein YbjT (DUF2867 family) [Spirosoma utsteinense]